MTTETPTAVPQDNSATARVVFNEAAIQERMRQLKYDARTQSIEIASRNQVSAKDIVEEAEIIFNWLIKDL